MVPTAPVPFPHRHPRQHVVTLRRRNPTTGDIPNLTPARDPEATMGAGPMHVELTPS